MRVSRLNDFKVSEARMRALFVSVFDRQRSTAAFRPKGCRSIYTCVNLIEHADHFFKRRISSYFV